MDFGIITEAGVIYKKDYVLSKTCKSIVFDYVYYTMDIDKPLENKFVRKMFDDIENKGKKLKLL